MLSRFALAASLALAVAACGSDNQPSEASTGSPSAAEATAAPAATAPGAVPSDVPSAVASPNPTPSPTKGHEHDADDDDHDTKPAGPPQAFNQCSVCHSTTPGKTLIGPSLAGVYGRVAGQVPGFQFSDAMKNSGMVLNEKNLDAFLANPAGKVPGTTMALSGIKDHEQREDIIDYLKTLK